MFQYIGSSSSPWMNKLLHYFKRYIGEYFHPKLYLTTLLFLVACLAFNFLVDFENTYVDHYYGSSFRWLLYFGMMAFPFLFVCGLLYVFDINRTWVYSREFWLLFFVGFVVISLERSFTYHDGLLAELDYVDRKFVRRLIAKFKPIFITLFSLLVFYYCYERPRDQNRSWYGLHIKAFDFKPYAFLILLVFLGIGVASFLGDLTQYYPRYLKVGGINFAGKHELSAWVPMVTYEMVYGLSFLGVEFFFRGFLVIGFARVLGGYTVLAMVGPYMFLHFGKPITECVSSIFGGYLIGILAYYSRHIWGGVILHVSLAWFMEFFAWLQKLYND
ncbi:hypothetical protein N6H18_09710 [Reichenbachiella agarivorans]|uniref:CAAX protease self-immunity n=1 Tax=Reichenbachiella agarivorans TaxID=2979464 RepID=A0ABY6CQQ5_9BACT|nr:hypothetical protein [Reichenbachiella agarivorans]UXP30630.1 hypothetical protein N6H18_09710 [Reichenbachiella agarivorans]